ncbi:hypothetical protein T265_07232 [Opisthorchis viverrini]|uniref:Uncharacterized protein n=1 Tax=Opisthorchis viverrini TaxID=6198 RepID=A0A074ZDC5_OPIVI|nr:hypothetical protein T265_07232 [Opisthorchis viverrini]KER25296.1 hypothetical protein T265_07232 [Opisthorchis viverrini]
MQCLSCHVVFIPLCVAWLSIYHLVACMVLICVSLFCSALFLYCLSLQPPWSWRTICSVDERGVARVGYRLASHVRALDRRRLEIACSV